MFNVSTVTLVLLIVFISLVECNDTGVEYTYNWSLRQKLKALENSLLHNQNLWKFLNNSIIENNMFSDDKTKAKRFYDNNRCIEDLEWIKNSFNSEESKWAFQMLNAWGKLPSGDFSLDFGNYDQCRKMISKPNASLDVGSQYCILEIKLNQTLGIVTTQPRSLILGICIPDSCSPNLIQAIIDEYLNETNTINTTIPADLCQLRDDNTKVFPLDICLIIFLVSVFFMVAISTIYDVINKSENNDKNAILMAFSAYSNGSKLFSCKSSKSPNVIACLHGIRAIAAQWIIVLHFQSLFYNRNSLINHSAFEKFHSTYRAGINSAQFSVDTFFTLSGMLVAISILRELSETNGNINLKSLYCRRYLRFTPVLVVLVLFQMNLLKFFASGPNNQLIDAERRYCENGWWSTLLYINIYYRGGCVLTSWYLSVDLQLFIFAPLLLILCRRYEKGFIFISLLILVAYFIAAVIGLHNFRNTIDGLYGSTYSRIPSWLIGVVFGYILFKSGSHDIRIPKYWNMVGMTVSVLLLSSMVYGINYFDDVTQYWYLWGTRSVWSIPLCYIIFSSVHGNGGLISWFLSLPQWQPLSRLSFITFLIHIMVIAVVKTSSKIGHYFSYFEFVQSFLIISGITFVIAAILSLSIEMPIATLYETYLLRKKRKD